MDGVHQVLPYSVSDFTQETGASGFETGWSALPEIFFMLLSVGVGDFLIHVALIVFILILIHRKFRVISAIIAIHMIFMFRISLGDHDLNFTQLIGCYFFTHS